MMRLLFILLPLISTTAFACPSGGGAEITINGVVSIETHPGPPNYESVESGDRAESNWFVTLEKPMCFSPDQDYMDSGVTINKLQLLLYKMKGKINMKEGKKYTFTGTTVPSHTGHHRTKVMLEVKIIKEL